MKKIFVLSVFVCVASLFADIVPWGGKQEVAGTGRFAFRNAILELQAGKSYRFDFKITKVAPLSAKKVEHQLVLFAVDGNKHKEIKTFAADVPVDGKTYQVSSAFTIPAAAKGKFVLFAYNCFAKGSVKLADCKIRELAPAEKINTDVTAVKAVVAATANPNEIVPSFSNRESGTIDGNGRFLYRTEVIPFKPGKKYNVSFDICKIAPLSEKNIEHRMVLAHNNASGSYREFAYFAENIPVDGKWHKVTGSFTVPTGGGKYSMFFYNCNADGSLQVKNLKFTLTDGKSVSAPAPAPAPAPKAVSAVKKAPDFEVVGNGKFTGGHFIIVVKPNSVCTFNFKMMKTPKMSSNPAEQRVVIAYIPTKGPIREIGYIGEKLPADSKWHDMNYSVKIPADSNGALRIYVYNCHATGKIALKDFTYQCK